MAENKVRIALVDDGPEFLQVMNGKPGKATLRGCIICNNTVY